MEWHNRKMLLVLLLGLALMHVVRASPVAKKEKDLHLPLNSNLIDKTTTTYNSHWKKRDQTPFGFHTIVGNGSTFKVPGKSMLGMILAFDLGHKVSLRPLLNQYARLCEAGWNINIIYASSTAARWTEADMKDLMSYGYCHRIQGSVGMQIEQHPKALNIKVAEKHRLTMKRNMDLYDVFVYQEDDIVISKETFEAYLDQVNKLSILLGVEALAEYAPGFLRFRVNDREDVDVKPGVTKQLGAQLPTDFGKEDIGFGKWQYKMNDAWAEELPLQEPVCMPLHVPKPSKAVDADGEKIIIDKVTQHPYIRLDGNIHQAAFVFTKQQLKVLEKSCQVCTHRMWNLGDQYGREYMSSFSIYWSFLFRQKTIPSCRLKVRLSLPLPSLLLPLLLRLLSLPLIT